MKPALIGILIITLTILITVPFVCAQDRIQEQVVNDELTPILEIAGYTNPIANNIVSASDLKAAAISNPDELKIPSGIQKFDLVTVDQQALNNEIRSGNEITMRIKGQDYRADLARMNFENIDDGIDSYEGTLSGVKDSNILLTISDEGTLGSITLGDETFWIEPVVFGKQQDKSIPLLHITYSSKDVAQIEFLFDNGPIESTDRSESFGMIDEKNGLQVTPPDQFVTVYLLVATDNQFYRMGRWRQRAQDIIATANQQFRRDDIKVFLNVVQYDDSRREQLSNHPEIISKPGLAFEEVYLDTDLDLLSADVALYLGGYNADGEAQGSSAGYPDGRHAWAQMVYDDPGYTGTIKGRRCVSIHELGHFFDAGHQDASHEYARAFRWGADPFNHWTVMWGTYSETAHSYEFSSDNYHGDSTHDNARRIRETRDTVANHAKHVFSIFASAGEHGSITPSGEVLVESGDDQTFIVESNSGYAIDEVIVDSESQGAVSEFTFSDVTSDHTISATFKSGQTPSSPLEISWTSMSDWDGWSHSSVWGGPVVGECYEYGPTIVNGHGEHGAVIHLNRGWATSTVERTFTPASGDGWNTLEFSGVLSGTDVPSGRWITIAVNGQQVYHGIASQNPPGNGQLFSTGSLRFSTDPAESVTVLITNGHDPIWGAGYHLEYHSLTLGYDDSEKAVVHLKPVEKTDSKFLITNGTKQYSTEIEAGDAITEK